MIAVCPNPFRDNDLLLSKKAVQLLTEHGYETVICPFFADEAPETIPDDIETVQLSDVADKISLAIVLGGDGTILAAVRALRGSTVPILGVNMGTKGFMTALEPENIELILEAANGSFRESRRMMLDVTLTRKGEEIVSSIALNDAVIHGYGDCIGISAMCDGKLMTKFSGDGVILSTPSGSTGYSMSAGGPIVEPEAQAIVFSPICAHTMSYRSFVLGADRLVQVTASRLHSRKAYLAIDGKNVCTVENGDIVSVHRSERCVIMAEFGNSNFFETAYEKLI